MSCDVVLDQAGFSGQDRLTCRTHQATLVAQPFMSQERFDAACDSFLKEHPSTVRRIK